MRILVNSEQWSTISATEQARIKTGLVQAGAIKPDDEIVPDANVAPFDPNGTVTLLWDPIGDLCRIACDTAAGAAFAWCNANTGGAALAVCLAAAEAARQECRRHC